MTADKPTTIINRLSFILVGLLAAGAFVLSYFSLWETALAFGLPSRLAWIWPLLVDFALIVFSLSVVRANLKGESVKWPWLLVGLYTVGTIAFNVLHAPADITSRIVAIVAPVSLFLSFETLMAMLKAEVKRNSFIRSISQLAQELAQKTQELADFEAKRRQEIAEEGLRLKASLESELSQLGQEVEARREEVANQIGQLESELSQLQESVEAKSKALESYNQDIEAKRQELKGLSEGPTKFYLPANLTVEQKRDIASQMANDGLTNEQIRIALGVSLATVKNYKQAAKELHLNGHNGKV